MIVVAASVFWGVTGRESSLIIGAGVTLITLGGFHGLWAHVEDDVEEIEARAKPKARRERH